jgi:hypothetical protein
MIAVYAWVVANWPSVLAVISGTVTIASIIVKLTPTPADDAFVAKLIAFLKILSLNKESK